MHHRALLNPQRLLSPVPLFVALNFGLHACTDVTGFGIAGHSLEMAIGSGEKVVLYYDRLPFYNDALRMYQKGETTGSNIANRKLVAEKISIKKFLSSQPFKSDTSRKALQV